MSTAPSGPAPPVKFPALAGVLSFLVPGLGQIVQGRVGKGLLFMVTLLSMFVFGQALGGWQNVYLPRDDDRPGFGAGPRSRSLLTAFSLRWHYAGQFFIGVAAWPALWQFYDQPMPEGAFWQAYQRVPDERELNNFLVNSDKAPDVGWIYTVIAGMLNMLVIYDAIAGPAHPRGRPLREAEPDRPAGQGVPA